MLGIIILKSKMLKKLLQFEYQQLFVLSDAAETASKSCDDRKIFGVKNY